jgi:hypothetical protein
LWIAALTVLAVCIASSSVPREAARRGSFDYKDVARKHMVREDHLHFPPAKARASR